MGHLSNDSDDGDDKMLLGAKREHKSVMDIAKFYTDAFFKDCADLNIRKPDIIVPATTMISEYISMIEILLNKGFAYKAGGNIYFDTTKLDDYYVLTNHKVDEMVVGVRDGVDEDLNKKNQADFVLWFTKSKFEDQELKWQSPWGYGYPGWHIECSGISMKYLGEKLDIHCGGVDNIFPHHTNEIAQSEAYLEHKWCNYWVHGEHLNDKSGKMSKSKGEFLTISLLEQKGYAPIVYRFMCLNSHYRKVLVFSYDALDNTKNAYLKLLNKVKNIKENIYGNIDQEAIIKFDKKFKNALEDDLNTSLAITILYDVLKDETISNNTKFELIKKFDSVLSLSLVKDNKIDPELEKYILEKIEERKQAKINKDYELADKIRKELEEKKILLKDTREGTIYEKMA